MDGRRSGDWAEVGVVFIVDVVVLGRVCGFAWVATLYGQRKGLLSCSGQSHGLPWHPPQKEPEFHHHDQLCQMGLHSAFCPQESA
jgi:hypothetical protein